MNYISIHTLQPYAIRDTTWTIVSHACAVAGLWMTESKRLAREHHNSPAAKPRAFDWMENTRLHVGSTLVVESDCQHIW